jgi:phosphoenolpyruvate synthase/pyruvate phosphate dikinase
MVVFKSLKEIGAARSEWVGTKAMSPAQLAKQGFRVPAAISSAATHGTAR